MPNLQNFKGSSFCRSLGRSLGPKLRPNQDSVDLWCVVHQWPDSFWWDLSTHIWKKGQSSKTPKSVVGYGSEALGRVGYESWIWYILLPKYRLIRHFVHYEDPKQEILLSKWTKGREGRRAWQTLTRMGAGGNSKCGWRHPASQTILWCVGFVARLGHSLTFIRRNSSARS